MEFKKVTLIGGGVLGSQIAYQAAYKGFDVSVYLRSDASVERAKPKFARLREIYLADLEASKARIGTPGPYSRGLIEDWATVTPEKLDEYKEKAEAAFKSVRLITDLAESVKDADLVIEALAEDPQQKIEFYRKLAPLLPEKTVIATNSSTLLPSAFRDYTGRPEKYLALHFANEIWKNNTGEVMGHDGTSKEAYDAVAKFAADIGMVPLCLHKEQPGYILNSMLVPFLSAAEALYANEVADPETIDKCWMLATGAPAGPFRILDVVGLTTAYNIVIMNPQASDPATTPGKIAAKLKEYIDAGKTGVNAGEGFYKYK
ncbi:MAG: 3-hydroxyacyl-CoA dehydrogenase [Oscillospiraceae bacterium]|nr:3-hydroxyacyl-CoA dehydrogenase [Oscillospiraceae bacterium]